MPVNNTNYLLGNTVAQNHNPPSKHVKAFHCPVKPGAGMMHLLKHGQKTVFPLKTDGAGSSSCSG